MVLRGEQAIGWVPAGRRVGTQVLHYGFALGGPYGRPLPQTVAHRLHPHALTGRHRPDCLFPTQYHSEAGPAGPVQPKSQRSANCRSSGTVRRPRWAEAIKAPLFLWSQGPFLFPQKKKWTLPLPGRHPRRDSAPGGPPERKAGGHWPPLHRGMARRVVAPHAGHCRTLPREWQMQAAHR